VTFFFPLATVNKNSLYDFHSFSFLILILLLCMKTLFSLLFAILALSANAQQYKPFKFNVSLGYAQPTGSAASAGVLFALEPKYGISNQIDLGIRLESALAVRSTTLNGNTGEAEVKGLGSALLTGSYFFSNNAFRPYLGAGAGIYRISGGRFSFSNGYSDNEYDLDPENKFGFLVRAGFKAGHFNFSAEYNGIAASTATIQQANFEGKNSYFGLKAGIDIGGGRR
jgi:outer membrane protein W